MKLKNDFKKILNQKIKEKEISFWQANSSQILRKNIYVTKDNKKESILEGFREEILITIYKDFNNLIGQSSFSIFLDSTVNEFEKQLEDTIYISQFSLSKKYLLPKKEDKIVCDKDIDYQIFYNKEFIKDFKNSNLDLKVEEKLNLLFDLIEKERKNGANIILNSCEIFNKISNNFIETSTNINKSFCKTSSYLELIITGIYDLENQIEHVVYEKINDFLTFDFKEFFKKQIKYVKDKILCENAPNFKGKVILSDFAAKDFFMPEPATNKIIMHAFSRFKYLGISNFEIGKKIINEKLDSLTIFSNPLLKLNLASLPYDNLGICAQKVCILKNNVFTNFLSSKQYADYLNIKPTGPFGCIEILPGKKSCKQLLDDKDKIIQIISFAWFNPDIVSGDFSAEIRFGYILENGKKIPFKGGLFSGNVMQICQEIELSSNMQNKPEYFGPKSIKFHKAKIIN